MYDLFFLSDNLLLSHEIKIFGFHSNRFKITYFDVLKFHNHHLFNTPIIFMLNVSVEILLTISGFDSKHEISQLRIKKMMKCL